MKFNFIYSYKEEEDTLLHSSPRPPGQGEKFPLRNPAGGMDGKEERA